MKKTILYGLLLLCSITYAQIPTTDLVGRYDFTNGALTDAINNVSFSKTGTNSTIIIDRHGNVDGAISLNGDDLTRTDIDFLTGGAGTSANYLPQTISFWLKTTTNDINEREIYNDNSRTTVANTTSFNGMRVFLKDGKINAVFRKATLGTYLEHTTVISDNVWHHIVIQGNVTYLNTGNLRIINRFIYIDGVKQGGSGNVSSTMNVTGPNYIGDMSFSGVNSSTSLATNQKYLDAIDQILFYKKLLSDAEVSQIMAYQGLSSLSRLYVNSNASGSNDGSTWANAFTSLSSALTATSADTEIWVVGGVYKPHATDRTKTFEISQENLKIYGGFSGIETSITERVLGVNETILSGDLGPTDVNHSIYSNNYSNNTRHTNSYHVINIKAAGNNLLLDGLTISDAHNNAANGNGGAILKDDEVIKLTIKNCIIEDNVGSGYGVGLLAGFNSTTPLVTSELIIENCKFLNNMSRRGSGIYIHVSDNNNSNIKITNSLFDQNIAGDINPFAKGNGGSAAWINNEGDNNTVSLEFVNNTITNNLDTGTEVVSAKRSPLGISKPAAKNGIFNANVSNCIFYNNKSTSNNVSKSISSIAFDSPTVLNIVNSIDEDNFSNPATSKINISDSNPLFTDEANKDFTLTDGSPAVNAGDNSKVLAGITLDLAGNQRVNDIVDMGAYENTTNIWTGTTNTDWSTPTNWSAGVPINGSNVIIPNVTFKPIINNAQLVSVKDLKIELGAELEINQKLTVEGNLVQNGSLIINSNATNNGSLILKGVQSGTNNVTYNRYVSDKWHLLSAPVSDVSIKSIAQSVNNPTAYSFPKYAIATYNNVLVSNRYVYFTIYNINASGNFIKGKGYSIKRKTTAGVLSFSGTLNTSDVPMVITDGSATGNKWNLVGNPFTASLNGNSNADAVNNFLTVNASELDPVRVAMYVWDAANSSYDIINQATGGSKYIAPGQGFFVESKDNGGTLQFTEAMQSHQTGNIFSKTPNVVPSIELLVSDGTSQKSTDIKYFSTATVGLDPGYDAGVFSGESQAFNVFTQLVSNDNTTAFGIQCLPTNNYEIMVIPVGVKAAENTTLSFSVAAQNLPNGINVYLEDKVNNTFTQLNTTQGNYTTTVSIAVNGVGRFYIHTTSSVLGIDDNVAVLKSVHIYTSAKTTLTITGSPNQGKNTVKIFNILGKEVFSTSFTAQQKATIQLPVNISTGVYLVKLQTVKGNVHKKVILN